MTCDSDLDGEGAAVVVRARGRHHDAPRDTAKPMEVVARSLASWDDDATQPEMERRDRKSVVRERV